MGSGSLGSGLCMCGLMALAPQSLKSLFSAITYELLDPGPQADGLFHFVPLPGSSGTGPDDEPLALPPWISAEPEEGVVEPGQSSTFFLYLGLLRSLGFSGERAMLTAPLQEEGRAKPAGHG